MISDDRVRELIQETRKSWDSNDWLISPEDVVDIAEELLTLRAEVKLLREEKR